MLSWLSIHLQCFSCICVCFYLFLILQYTVIYSCFYPLVIVVVISVNVVLSWKCYTLFFVSDIFFFLCSSKKTVRCQLRAFRCVIVICYCSHSHMIFSSVVLVHLWEIAISKSVFFAGAGEGEFKEFDNKINLILYNWTLILLTNFHLSILSTVLWTIKGCWCSSHKTYFYGTYKCICGVWPIWEGQGGKLLFGSDLLLLINYCYFFICNHAIKCKNDVNLWLTDQYEM